MRSFCTGAIILTLVSLSIGCFLTPSSIGLSNREDGRTVNQVEPASNNNVPTFDAGVIFPEETCIVRFPLAPLGIKSPSEITAIHTSCECVSAVARKFIDQSGAEACAVEFRFHKDQEGPTINASRESNAASLRIILQFKLELGTEIPAVLKCCTAGNPPPNRYE